MKRKWKFSQLLVMVLLAFITVIAAGCDFSMEPEEHSAPAEMTETSSITDSLLLENVPAFPLNITMTKFSPNGVEKGDYDITINADSIVNQDGKLYLPVTISDFDGNTKIIASKDETGYVGEVFNKWDGYHYVMCFGSEQWFRLCFDSQFDRWALYSEELKPYYVGSVSGQYTNEELLGYFRLGDSTKSVEFPRSLTKVDQEGNASLDFQLNIEGSVGESSDGTAWLRAKIDSFDSITDIETVNDSDSDLPEIQTLPSMELQFVICSGLDGGKPAAVNLYFSPDLERWMFYNISDKTYFVGSVNGKYSTQDLYEYFSPIIIGHWPAE